ADADAILEAAAPAIAANLFATAGILADLDFRLTATDAVIVHPADRTPDRLVATTRAAWTPSTILSVFADAADLPPTHPASGKRPVDDLPTAYVCHGETCSLPVTDPDTLAMLLRDPRSA
ncbi:MAG: hypothetical protein KDJ88_10860, partial [Bauldia sp.]|nr:hypothetical protein [Bauldia sp.]